MDTAINAAWRAAEFDRHGDRSGLALRCRIIAAIDDVPRDQPESGDTVH